MSWVAIAVGGIVGTTAGGISSAVKGEPVWKGMLIGAGTGLAGGALGAGLGALGGAAGGGAGGAAGGTGGAAGGAGGAAGGGAGGGAGGVTGGTTGAVGGTGGGAVGGASGGGGSAVVNPAVQAALTESPTAITSQGMGAATNAPTIGIGGAAPVSSAPVTSTAESGLTSMIDKAIPALKGSVPGMVLDTAKGFTGGTTFTGDAGKEQEAKEAQGSQWAADTYQQPGGSWLPGKAEGGVATIRAARGGSVRLKNGDYVVPADVVSALGNGSTKAGAKYLTHLCNSLHAGPAPKAGSLAKQRAKARHAA